MRRGVVSFEGPEWESVTDRAKHLILALLDKDRHNRCVMPACLSHAACCCVCSHAEVQHYGVAGAATSVDQEHRWQPRQAYHEPDVRYVGVRCVTVVALLTTMVATAPQSASNGSACSAA